MNVIDFSDAKYVALQTMRDRRVGAFHQWWAMHPQRSVITEAITSIAELIALDEARCAEAGCGPRPAQEMLSTHQIIPAEAIAKFRKLYQEAAH